MSTQHHVPVERQALLVIGALDGHPPSLQIVRECTDVLAWDALTPIVLSVRPNADAELRAMRGGA